MPLALLTAFVGLHYTGVPANMLSMGAIDFGILLEGAVDPGRERVPPPGGARSRRRERVAHVVAAAAKEVVRPTLFSMAIIGAAMMPIFTMERVEGRIFRPVALTYAFALAGALLFTLTTVPALTTALLKRAAGRGHVHSPVLAWLRGALPGGLRGDHCAPVHGRRWSAAALVGGGGVAGAAPRGRSSCRR